MPPHMRHKSSSIGIVSPIRSFTLFCALCAVAAAGDSTGKLTIYLAGKLVAHETYAIKSADGKISIDGSGLADMGLLKINIEQFKVVTDSNYKPLEAVARAQMGKAKMAVDATFAGETVKSKVDMGQGPADKEDQVHGDDLVINANLPIFPWSILMARVKLDSSAPQQFYAFVLGQSEAPLTIVSKGKETVEFANKKARLNHLSGNMTLPTGPVEAEFWIDDDRRIIKMLVPGQGVEVYQDGYERVPPPPKPDGVR
jgi:hypothetical protein